MPPIRNTTAPKPMKTERTHEENQERAYVAASRRSDRSLEARVESARRASEIHKRRTGRSLKVDEQSVLNEDMYEEEDDDLPTQMRRLTAHLHMTGANEFHRRFNAYVAQHVALRQTLGNAMADPWQQANQFNSNPNVNGQYMDPGLMQLPPQPSYPNQMYSQPQMTNPSPGLYRQSPYPMPTNHIQQQGIRPNIHNRSASIATPQELQNYQHLSAQQSRPAQPSANDAVKASEDRRMSLPAQNAMPPTPQSQQGSHNSPALSRKGSVSNASTPHALLRPASQSPQQAVGVPQRAATYPSTSTIDNTSPLSSTLAPNVEQVLADNPSFLNDPMLSAMMPLATGLVARPNYSYNPNGKSGKNTIGSVAPKQTEGLSQTLMPAALDTNLNMFGSNPFLTSPASAGTEQLFSPRTPTCFGIGFEGALSADGFDMFKSFGTASQTASGQVTPQEGEHNWDSFLNFADDPILGMDPAAAV